MFQWCLLAMKYPCYEWFTHQFSERYLEFCFFVDYQKKSRDHEKSHRTQVEEHESLWVWVFSWFRKFRSKFWTALAIPLRSPCGTTPCMRRERSARRGFAVFKTRFRAPTVAQEQVWGKQKNSISNFWWWDLGCICPSFAFSRAYFKWGVSLP